MERNIHGVGIFGVGTDGSEFGNITDHFGKTSFLANFVRKFVPDVEPVTVLFINLRTTDFDLAAFNHSVSKTVNPTPRDSIGSNSIKTNSNIHIGDKITVAVDVAGNSATKVSGTVPGLLNRFNREVSVTSVDDLEKSNLRITRKVNILLVSL